MGSSPMVTTNHTSGRRRRLRLTGACAMTLALAAGAIALPAAPAHAADPITAADQSYFAYYKLDQARAKGYTGKGVTIALIDGEVDTSAPELAGATIIDKTPCTVTSSNESKTHGTLVASLLGSSQYGVAPDASILTYRSLSASEGDSADSDCYGDSQSTKHSIASLLNHAMNDGASVISVAQAVPDESRALKWAIARSMHENVVIVSSMGNERRDQNITHLSRFSGVVGVSAIDLNGKLADYSSWGQGVTTTAFGGPVTVRNYADNQIGQTSGTSISAPLTAGFITLAKQKWPNATSNQLLQLLTHTARTDQDGWNIYTGFGRVDPGALVNTDPSQYPDENPIADKGGGSSPTAEEVQAYADGVVAPTELAFDDSYTYRGLDESVVRDTDITTPIHLGTSPRYHAK